MVKIQTIFVDFLRNRYLEMKSLAFNFSRLSAVISSTVAV